ncbi:MAG: hypothetical protein IJA79_00720 [Desulfovibrio sp.]|nr:hypothetical protein [Desulfovibrio sp.]
MGILTPNPVGLGGWLMGTAIPVLSADQEKELDSIFSNERLVEFMESGIHNSGDVEPDNVILDRQIQAIEAFSQLPESFWEFK